jgi:hypothetical protein
MSDDKKQSRKESSFRVGDETYREPIRQEQKDESYREPRPQKPSQEGDQK